MNKLKEKIRWRFARWLDNRRPTACWADLASWAMGTIRWEDICWDVRRHESCGWCFKCQALGRTVWEDGEWKRGSEQPK